MLHVSPRKGTMLLRIKGQSIIQRPQWEQCALLHNAFKKYKIQVYWLWENKSQDVHKCVISRRKQRIIYYITQSLLICVKSAHELGCVEKLQVQLFQLTPF